MKVSVEADGKDVGGRKCVRGTEGLEGIAVTGLAKLL